jgi:hypothetical protein
VSSAETAIESRGISIGKEVNTEIISDPNLTPLKGGTGMNQRFKSKWLIAIVTALAFSCLGASRVSAEDGHGTKVKWDIFQYEDVTATTFTIAPGGISTSQATFYPAQLAGDNSTITLTGSGTFRLNEGHDVTGGGTWETAAADGTVTGSGTYRVTELVFFEFGAGTLAGVPGITDETGNLDDTGAGLAVLRVHYPDR